MKKFIPYVFLIFLINNSQEAQAQLIEHITTKGGPFDQPEGIAVDNSGNIYIVDINKHRIVILNSSLQQIKTIGEGFMGGSSNNQFIYPKDIALDTFGNLYITDKNNSRVQIFDSSYQYKATIGGNGRGAGDYQFNEPEEIAVDKQGNIYVADSYNNRIQIFDSTYQYKATIGGNGRGAGDYQLNDPIGIAVDDNSIYVSDQNNNRIQIFDLSYQYKATIGGNGAGTGEYQFDEPKGLAVDKIGYLYVADRRNDRVQVFNSTLQYVYSIERSGYERLEIPGHIAIDAVGNIYVTDAYDLDIYKDLSPSLTISSPESKLTNQNPIPINIDFSEEVRGVTSNSFTVNNGSITNLHTVDSAKFIADFIPTTDGEVQIKLEENKTLERNGYQKGNLPSNVLKITYDSTAPFFNIITNENDSSEVVPLIFRITPSEEVIDFEQEDIIVSNGAITKFTAPYGTRKASIIGNSYPYLQPEGMDINSNGQFYIADGSNHRVQIFDSTYKYISAIGGNGFGTNNNQFNYPSDVKISDAGDIYIVDQRNHRIQIFDQEHNYKSTIGGNGEGSGNLQFANPTSIAIDKDGNIYIVDRDNHRIQVFDQEHNYKSTIGGNGIGSGNYQFNVPNDLAIDAIGNIYIADYGNHRIQILDPNYTYLATIGEGGYGINRKNFEGLTGITVDGSGNIYALDKLRDCVVIFDRYKNHIATIGGEGLDNDEFYYPSKITTDGKGNLYISDSGNDRVEVYTIINQYLLEVSPLEDGAVLIEIGNETVLDKAGNSNVKSSFTHFHNLSPSVTIKSKTISSFKDTLNFEVTFSEKVKGFHKNKITISNGNIQSLHTSDSINFTGNVIPSEDGLVEILVDSAVVTDLMNKPNKASNKLRRWYDSTPPIIDLIYNDSTDKNPIPVTIKFNEPIKEFRQSDLIVSNGTISNFAKSIPKFSASVTIDSETSEYPSSVGGFAIDRQNNLYVAYGSKQQVYIFDRDLNQIGVIGNKTASSQDYQIKGPTGVGVDNSGNLLIVDAGNDRIQIFDASYKYKATIGGNGKGSGDYQFNLPTDIAINHSGNILVVDKYNNRIQIFDASYNYTGTIGGGEIGTGNYQLHGPNGLFIDSKSHLYVADMWNHRIQIFDSTYNYIATIGGNGKGSGDYQFNLPTDVSVDRQGNIYVTDHFNDRVQVFDYAYQYKYTIGSKGSGDGQFFVPEGIVTNPYGDIYVATLYQNRFQVFTQPQEYYLEITPDQEGPIGIKVEEGKIQDIAGNLMAQISSEILFNKHPSVSITTAVKNPTNLSVIPNKIKFNELVSGFEVSDIKINNGSISTLVTTDSISFTADILPFSDGIITIQVEANKVTDIYGQGNKLGYKSLYYDSTDPKITIDTIESDKEGLKSVKVNFSERVVGFGQEDINISNADIVGITEKKYRLKGMMGGNGLGTNDNQLNYPTNLAIDKSGRIFIADNKNHRIQVYDNTYNYITTFGSYGTANGQFNRVNDIKIDAKGRIIISDSMNDRIQVFDSAYNYLHTIGRGTGSKSDQFSYPMGIAVDERTGNLLIADFNNSRIQVFNSSFEYVHTIGGNGSGSENNQFSRPTDVFTDEEGNVYVADRGNHRVQIFDNSFNYKSSIGSRGSSNSQFIYPYGTTLDNLGNIYVADRNNNRIQIFDPAYNYVETISRNEINNISLSSPEAVFIDESNNIYIVDCANHRVLIFEQISEYELTVKPQEESLINIAIDEGASHDLAGNGNEKATFSFWNDSIAPTAHFAYYPESTNRPFTTRFLFREKVKEFNTDNILVQNGTITNLSTSDSINFEIHITPKIEGTVLINIPSYVAQDMAGNYNLDSIQTHVEYDITPPTLVINSINQNSNRSEIPFTITCSEKITAFSVSNIKVKNGILLSNTTSDSITFISMVKPINDGEVKLDIPIDVIVDKAQNSNKTGETFSVNYDSTDPTVVLSTSDLKSVYSTSFSINIRFSERVKGFTINDIEVDNAHLIELNTLDSLNFSAKVIPSTEGIVSLQIPSSMAWDSAGNFNEASSQIEVKYDTTSTNISSTDIISNDVNLSYIITFSEKIADFSLNKIQIINGIATSFHTSDSTSFQAKVTPIEEGKVTVSIPANIFSDEAGNTNLASNSYSIDYDSKSPIASISSKENTLSFNSSFNLDINLNEPVKGFGLDDIQVDNANLVGLHTLDSIHFSVQVYPIVNGLVTIQIPEGVIADRAGNYNEFSEAFIVTYEADTLFNLMVKVTTLNHITTPPFTATLYQLLDNKFSVVEMKEVVGNDSFSFDEISEGIYTVGLQPLDTAYLPIYLGNHLTLFDAKTITINQDTIQHLSLDNNPINPAQGEAVVSGVLLSSTHANNGKILFNYSSYEGQGIPNIPVYLKHPETNEILAYDITDQYGKFSFLNLEAGEYLFIADFNGIPNDEEQNLVQINTDFESITITAIVGKVIKVNEIQIEKQVTNVKEEILNTKALLYPNPGVDVVSIDLNHNWLGGQIMISELTGKVLFIKEINYITTKLDLTELISGVYLITIVKENDHQTFKFYKL